MNIKLRSLRKEENQTILITLKNNLRSSKIKKKTKLAGTSNYLKGYSTKHLNKLKTLSLKYSLRKLVVTMRVQQYLDIF
jgi:hypothetical protein